MVKLVDMPDLGSGAARRVGSSPIIRTKKASHFEKLFLFIIIYDLRRVGSSEASGLLSAQQKSFSIEKLFCFILLNKKPSH